MLLGAKHADDPLVQASARAVLRASEALRPVEPLAGPLGRARIALGEAWDPLPLLEWWRSRAPGNPRSEMRYRWELTHRRGVPMPDYAPSEQGFVAWRAEDAQLLEKDPFEFEARLLTPVILTETAELLAEVSEGSGHAASLAAALLEEASPVLRRDFAGFVQAVDPWQDTFALWRLVQRPRALALLHPLAVAIATCYAASTGDRVVGLRFPFHNKPLVSASAQLAAGLLALGSDLELVARLVDFVLRARRGRGWGDGAEVDVLTSWAAADLLACVDPSFDPEPTARLFQASCGADGFWRALGPDAPWLTLEVLRWLLAARRPFAERFRWPFLHAYNRDRKTLLPFYAYFVDLSRLFAALPGLSSSNTPIAFVDLAGFRNFNNRHGQGRGDAVLHEFARALEAIPSARAIRDGGDEFLIVGAPERADLSADIDALRRAWPARFQAVFGADIQPVAPRILVGRVRGDALTRTRELLGREIGSLKSSAPVPPEGILVPIS
jgi:GGDEF domain-containing protein